MTFELRDYQIDLVTRASLSMLNGEQPCVVSSTGSGKTVILAELCRLAGERGEKVLAACHRIEIMQQIVGSLYKHLGEMPQIITAANTTPMRDVTVCMIPTLVRRQQWIDRLQNRTYLLDEAHHHSSKSYQNLYNKLNPGRFAGLTATPISSTGGGLGSAGFTELVLGPDPRELMDKGALADYVLYGAPHEVDTTGLTIRAGDYVTSELEERVVQVAGNIYRDWRQFNPEGKSTLCVGVSVQHAHELARMFTAKGVTAVALDGTTPAPLRKQVMDDFRAGKITVLCACSIIEEGTDLPEANVLQLIRPTRSIRLYRQLIGRVLRAKKDGSKAIIIDNSSSWRDLPLPCEHIEWSLEERIKTAKPGKEQNERDEDCAVTKKIKEDNTDLQLISKVVSLRERRIKNARGRLHEQLDGVRTGIVIPNHGLLKSFARDAQYYTPEDFMAIQDTCPVGDKWVETQMWLNGPPC